MAARLAAGIDQFVQQLPEDVVAELVVARLRERCRQFVQSVEPSTVEQSAWEKAFDNGVLPILTEELAGSSGDERRERLIQLLTGPLKDALLRIVPPKSNEPSLHTEHQARRLIASALESLSEPQRSHLARSIMGSFRAFDRHAQAEVAYIETLERDILAATDNTGLETGDLVTTRRALSEVFHIARLEFYPLDEARALDFLTWFEDGILSVCAAHDRTPQLAFDELSEKILKAAEELNASLSTDITRDQTALVLSNLYLWASKEVLVTSEAPNVFATENVVVRANQSLRPVQQRLRDAGATDDVLPWDRLRQTVSVELNRMVRNDAFDVRSRSDWSAAYLEIAQAFSVLADRFRNQTQ